MVEKRNIVLNQTIKIIKGSFINQVGRVYEIQGNRVKVVIDSLGLALIANFPITAVESYPMKNKNL
jgi:transcription antitermination factor NusG